MRCEIPVRVVTRASKPGVAGMRGDAVLVRVGAPPVEGAANAEVIELLARALDLPPRAVAISAGATSRTKRVAIDGLTREDAFQRLGLP